MYIIEANITKLVELINRKRSNWKKMKSNQLLEKKQMIKLLIVCSDKFHLFGMVSFLKAKDHIDISWASNGQIALNIVSDNTFDLVIADDQLSDMTGLGFIQKLISINPIVNSALVSTLSHDKFHEQSEGLGILTQLPIKPDEEHANDLLEKLKKILN